MAATSTAAQHAPAAGAAQPRPSFRPDIEGLRALAIIPVVLFHAHEFLPAQPQGGVWGAVQTVLGWVPGGYLGVDVFFVISGYLITGLLVREAERSGRVHFGRFYARRARRILPAATVTLLVVLVASFLILPAARAATTATDVLWAALFNSDVHFVNSGIDYMGMATDPSPVLHFWSLNDEEKFYVVWPAVLLAATVVAHRMAPHRLRAALFAALLVLAVPSLLWSQHLVATGDNAAYFSALSRGFELAAGGLLAIAMPAVLRAPRALRVSGSIVGFLVVVACILTFTTLTPFPGVNALPVVLGTLLVIAGHESGVVNRGLAHPLPRWFGRVSYSLYLWHWPVLVLGAALTATGLLSVPQALLGVAVSVLLAWGSWRFVEQPPQSLARLRPTRSALLLGLSLILVTVLASIGVGRAAVAKDVSSYADVASGIPRETKADNRLLYIGDSITDRGLVPLTTALDAGHWNASIDSLGGRPIVAGNRPTWTPLCLSAPGCGADLVLKGTAIPPTVVIAVGTNSFGVAYDQVRPPTATDSGRLYRRDASGQWIIAGQDSPADFARAVDRIMAMVPSTTTVNWVGIWLDDSRWKNVTWRQDNAAMKAAAAKHPNAFFLDYAAYVDSAHIPYMPDGSHPTPVGMGMRAHWIVSHLH